MPVGPEQLAQLKWQLETLRPLASAIRPLLEELGDENDYREDRDWVAARLDATGALRSLLTAEPAFVTTELAASLFKGAARRAFSAELSEENEYFDTLLFTILEPLTEYDNLSFKVTENIEHFTIPPGEDSDHPDGYTPTIALGDALHDAAPVASLRDRRVSITGDFVYGTRELVINRLHEMGAMWVEEPADGADLLIVGACAVLPDGTLYRSKKLDQALGSRIAIAHECQVTEAMIS